MQIGHLGGSKVTKVIGIVVNDNIPANFSYTPGVQPFNSNFASILFELREAGLRDISHYVLDYATADRQLVTPAGNLNAYYFNSYRTSAGMTVSRHGEKTIWDSIINGLAL